MLHVNWTTIGAMVIEENLFEVFLNMFFLTYELEQNNASKQKVGHCDKTTLQIFFYFYNSKYLCFTDIPCQNSAKHIR